MIVAIYIYKQIMGIGSKQEKRVVWFRGMDKMASKRSNFMETLAQSSYTANLLLSATSFNFFFKI